MTKNIMTLYQLTNKQKIVNTPPPPPCTPTINDDCCLVILMPRPPSIIPAAYYVCFSGGVSHGLLFLHITYIIRTVHNSSHGSTGFRKQTKNPTYKKIPQRERVELTKMVRN